MNELLKGYGLRRVFNPVRGDYCDGCFELNLVEKGRVLFYCGFGSKEISEGGWVLFESKPSAYMVPMESSRVFQLRFKKDFLPDSLLALPTAELIRNLVKSLGRGVYCEDKKLFGVLLFQMNRMLDTSGWEVNLQILKICGDISQSAEKKYISPIQSIKSSDLKKESTIERVNQYMETHYGEALRIENLANLVGLTPTSFCRYYKRNTGITPISFLNQIRLRRACELLDSTDYTVQEIVAKCGYMSNGYFMNLFKTTFGCTPQQFRNR